MPDDRRGESHRVTETDDERDGRLDGPPRFVIAENKNQRDQHERDDRRLRRVAGGLLHLVNFQNRLAGHAHVQAADFLLRLGHELAQARHGEGIRLLVNGARGHEVDVRGLGEGDVDFALRLLTAAEKRGDARRGRRALPLQAVAGLREDAPQRRQRLDQGRGPGIFLALAVADLPVHQVKQGHEIVRAAELLQERAVIAQRLSHLAQVIFRHEEQRLRAEHLQVALIDHVHEEVRLCFQLRAQPLDELPVLFLVLALDHDHEFVRQHELFFILEKILVVLLVAAHEVVAAGIKLQMPRRERGVPDAEGEERDLRKEKPARVTHHGVREAVQQARANLFPA